MRMWHKDVTEYLCNVHLNAAHSELHKFRPSFIKKYSISGRIFPEVQIEPWRMKEYHDELVVEMLKRKMNHQSPYEQPDISYLPEHERNAKVDINVSLAELVKRCPGCRANITGGY